MRLIFQLKRKMQTICTMYIPNRTWREMFGYQQESEFQCEYEFMRQFEFKVSRQRNREGANGELRTAKVILNSIIKYDTIYNLCVIRWALEIGKIQNGCCATDTMRKNGCVCTCMCVPQTLWIRVRVRVRMSDCVKKAAREKDSG